MVTSIRPTEKTFVPSQRVNYPEYEDFLILLFSILKEQLDTDPKDPLPDYRKENSEQLHKILELVKNDDYYSTLLDKASYLLTSIIQGHIYSNGNKRLALITTLYFLNINGYELEPIKRLSLYGLAIHLADSQKNGGMNFDERKAYALKFLNTHSVKAKNDWGRRLWDRVSALRRKKAG